MSRLDELRKNKGKYTLVLDEGAEEEAGKAYWAKHYTAPPKPESVLPSYGPSATNRAVQEVVGKNANNNANTNLSYEQQKADLRAQKRQARKDKVSAAIDSILGQVTVDEGRINQAQQDYNAASQRLKDSKTALADLKKNKWDETQKYNQNQLEQNAELKSLVAMAYKAKLNADMAQTTKANLYPGNAAAAQTGLDPASVANSQAVSDYNSYFKKIEEMGYDANSLLDTYTRNSNKQLTEKIEEKTNDFADKHPVIASGAHVALNAFQAPAMEDIVRTGLQSAISDEYIPIDTNAPTFAATNVRDSISGQVTGDIQQKVIDKTDNETLANAAVFLYQTGLSIGDFASVAALPQPASLAIMGTSAAVSTAKDATERGISADKAALTAIAAGASEIIFEKLSLENLNALKATGRSGVENTVKDILKQTFTEGSEEVFTDIANAISDQIINGDNSAIMQNYRKFIDEGMSEGEARKQTAISFGKQIGESFLGGAISGGIMGAGGVAYGNIAQTNYYRAVGNEIKQNGTAQDVINTGLNTDTQSKTYQAAMELQSRLERSSYDNNSESADYSVLSSKKLGQLQLANENLGSQTNLINAVADSENTPLTAVAKFAAGEELSDNDVTAIKSNPDAIRAINQEYGTNLTADNISKFELNQLSDTVSKNVAYPFRRNYSAENAKKNSVSYNIPATDKFGKPVDITDISVEQGNVVVTTAENEKINSNDLNFQNSETTELFERASVYPTNAAKSFIAGYDYSSEQSVRDYAIGFSDIYIDTARSGATANMTAETAIAMGTDKNLAPQQAFLAYSAAVNEFKGGNKGKSKEVKNNGNIKAQFDAALKSNTVGTTVIGTPKTSMQNAEIALLDEVAKNNNLSVIVVDSVQDVMNEDSNAAAVNDKIVIGLDTQNGMLLPYAGHELFHILKENKNSSATAKELQSFIIDVLKNDASYNYGERFNELQSAYKFKGTDAEITDMINEEIAANACFTVLSNEKNFNSLVKQNKSLAQRVYDFFADFLNQIKERLVTLAKQNKEYKALHNEYKIQDKIVSMMKTALGEYQKNNTATNDSVASTGIKFSKKMDDYSYDERKIIDGYLEAVDNEILQFYNNAINKIPQVPKINIGKVTSKMSDEILEVLGIDTTGWNIKFEDRIAKHIDKDHGANGITDKSMSNSNDVARMKFIIDNHDYYGSPATTRAYKINVNGFNKNAPTITFAKKINGTYYLVMAVPKNKTLWIVTAFMNKKIEAAQFRNASNETLRHTAKTDAASTSINTVSQTDTDVNNNSMQNSSKYSLRDSDGNELTEQQQEYFKDSKVRDENGNLLVMYHGTPNEFTVFKNKGDGSYFTPDKEYASGYTQAMNDFDGYVMSVYLNITKPFDINDKKTRDIFINEYIKGGWAQGISPYSTDVEINKYIERGLDWTEGSNLIEFIEENELDYDGLIIDEGSFADGDWEYSGKGANAKWRGYSYVIFNSNQAKNVNNTNPTDNEDIRFSLKEPVEQTKDLIAVHNVTEDKLLNSLKLGGLPSPSIAIMKARVVDANANFGNISLVFSRNTIDPQVDSDNKLYSSDAYTPISVQPEYKLNEKKANDLYSKIRELSNKKAAFKKNSVEFHIDNLTDRINRAGGLNNLLIEYQKDYGMKQLFLADTGNQIEKTVQKTIEIYNSDELAAIKSISMQLKDVLSTVTIDKIDREFIVDNSAIIEKVEELKGKKVFEKCLELYAAKSYLDGTLEKTKNVDDVEATEKAIDSRVNQKEYEKWLNDLFVGVVEKKGIRNNVDTYTASGNRRNWEKFYWDYNLENIVKAMKEQNAQGGNFLVSNIFGGSAQRFNSIDELKDNANRLQKIDDEEYEQIKKILNSRFNEICNSMDKHNNPFAIADVVVEALSKYKTKSGIANYMKTQLKGWAEYSDAAMDDIWNLVCDIRALPVNYFEAKPQRAVYFNEVYTAVIPDNSSKELINALDDANINYQTYEDGNEQSRMDLLNSLDDVKFSMRESNKDVEKLLKENAQLQDANELLRQELQLTKGHRLNQSNIKSIAKSFIKKYGAYELDEQTLYNKLSALYDYMANAGSMIDDRYIWSVANDIAKNIIKVSTVKDTEFYNEYKPLKKRLRETAITVPADVRREVSSYSNINKLRIRNNGSIALDSFYNELAADYPELFDSSVLSEADQLSRIIEVYESIAPIYTDRLSQSGYTLEEYSSIVAAEIFDKYFNVKEMPTFADKKQQELEQLKLHYSNAIDDMRKQYDKRYNERERQLKEKLKNVNARNQQKLIKQQAHFTEMSLNAFHRKRRTIAKNKIANVKKDLTRRLLNPTETSYVPMSLVQKVADICDLINETQIKDKNNFDRSQNIINELQLLHSAYEELKSYPDVDYASEYEQEMGTNISLLKNALEQSITDSDSGTLQVSQLDYSQLEDIYHILRDIKNALVDATYQIGLDERISNHQRGIKIINELNETKGWRNAHIGRYEMETLNPVRAVRKITEYNDDAELYKLVNELNLGQRKADKFISDASKPFYNLRQQAKEFTRFSSAEVETNIVDKNGNKVKMTENEIVQLIMTMKRRQGKNHLKEKGFILPDRKLLKKGKHKNALAQGTVIERLNPYEVNKMYDNLSDYAKAWVSASQYLFNEQGKNAINETSMLLKHKKIATAENYIPIQVDTEFTSKEIQGLKFDGTIEGMGSLKSVVNKANQPLVIQGLNTVVDKHINDVSKYYGLAIPIRNFNKVFGVQTSDAYDLNLGRNTVRVALRTKWGDAGLKLFDNLITDLQTSRSTGGKSMASEILDKVQSGFVQATLASNISVTIKQAASYPTALANLSGKSLGVGLPVFGYNTKQLDKLFAEIDEHTGIHFKRRIGMSSQELGELTKENAFINKIPATINPMKWIQAMDVKTTAALWVAVKYDVKKLYPDIKVNSEEYFEKVTSLYEETIENTQPNYDVLHRPEVQKEKGIMRSIAMFKTQPLQNTGILYDSLFEYRKKHSEYNKNKTDENKFALEQAQRKFRKAVISQFSAAVTFSAMSMLAAMARHTMYGYRDDDDEVTWKSIVAGLMNSMGNLFFTLLAPVGGGELYEFTKSLGDGYTSDFVSVPVVTTINDLCSSINKVVKTANGVVDGENEPKDLLSSVEDLGYSVATIFGIPVKNAVNYSKGIVANIKDAVNGEFGKFEAGIDRKPRQNVERYGKYLTGDSYKENPSKAKEILDEMISDKKEALLAAGETAAEAEKEARKSVRNSFSNYYKEQYQEAFSKKDAEKRRQIINILKSTGLFVYETKRTLADVISDWEEETKK